MKLAYVDSSIWITRVEGLPVYRAKINDCLNQLLREEFVLCSSSVVKLEIFPKLYKDKNTTLVEIYNKLFKQTCHLENFSSIFEQAVKIAYTENLKAMDAIHVTIAIHHDCQYIVSTDSHFKNLTTIRPVWIDLN
ncbi:type II toxin-antitoxin system VapC family toxin [Thiotrichales bacterium HSG1]|nr:type II toxin-antitoxin system VapC family toxin [Thiotrichales bacterium HSG1]